MFRSYTTSIWLSYKSYVEAAINLPSEHPLQDIEYWQKRLFTTGVLYALPLSLLALIPCIYFESRLGFLYTAGFKILMTIAFAFLSLAPGLTLNLRKALIASMVALISIALTILFGEFSMCSIYLLSLSAFVALIYSNRIAFITVIFNFFVLASFALAIRFHAFNLHLIINTTFDRWVIYSLNFILMNLIVVGLIRQILNGLVRTMRKEAWLFNKLQKESEQIGYLNHNLQKSKEDYKMLFFQSPLPKLIFDIDSLKFLQVNIAATEVYGYAKEEFLKMKLTDILPEDCSDEMLKQVNKDDTIDPILPYMTLQIGKDGRHIHTEVRRNDITFKGKKARMIITTDITQRVKFTDAIQQQNEKLREIAYIQSHVIRHPLARIMSISELINLEYNSHVDPELLKFLNISTLELDAVIREVISKSEKVFSAKFE